SILTFLRNPLGAISTVMVLVLVFLALFAPGIWGAQANQTDTSALLQGPSAAHPLGTDGLGRDLLLRTLVAARLSLGMALIATVIGLVFGLLLGALPSVLGPRVQRLFSSVISTWLAFPVLLVAMLTVILLGPSSSSAVIALGLTMVPSFARLAQTLSSRVGGSEYLAAARMMGVSRGRQFTRYVLPNIAEPIIVNVTLSIGGGLLALSSLSFLGVGVQPPDYDWGRMLSEAFDQVYTNPTAVVGPGVAVVFAGVTVLIALIGLGFAGIPFLTTMGIAASVAVAVAVAIAVTLTPALLGFLGHRVAGRPKKPRAKTSRKTKKVRAATARAASEAADGAEAPPAEPRPRGSRRWVAGVTRRPILVSLAIVLGLGVVAVPALSLDLALPNAGVLPKDSEARQTYDLVGEQFGPGFNGPLILTGTIVTSTDPLGLMEDLGDAVAEVPGVKEVALATPNETADTGIVQIIPETAPDDPATADLVRELRSHHDEWLDEFGIDLKVTGFTAAGIDISDQLGAALLPFGIFVIGLSLILLTIVFRSLWVPITAAAGYLLSIVAAFGVVGAVFEWGWFADALHVAKVGPIISFMPIILMGVLFGLAMDYQVFLVSRMREDFVHDPDAKSPDRTTRRAAALRAVRSGFSGSAKVVTAAGLIMFAVFVAFVPEGDSSLKPIALGLAAGIAIDAFLVRMTLIPALMAILGERAWEIPAWLERILPSVDIEGEAVERERHLAAWPGDGSVVAADDLTVGGDIAALDGLSLRLAPGSAVVATGLDAATLRVLALTIAGRVPPGEGRLRVAG
ncbi:MAG: ABC transporter permease subunit, partial [Microbacterium sp.]|nr:ABC transporter permease subunit [Microbacterium sp.]